MDANMLLAWHKYGGGKELLNKLYNSIGANVVSFPYGPMPTQPLGWYKKPITKPDDFKGLKFRTVGISIDVFTGMGAAVNALPGGEIVSAMDRGLLDAAEFNNASSDRALGFADVSKVCMLQSYHQNAEQFEITFNKTKYDALPDKLKAIIANAVDAASADMSQKAIDRYSQDYVELQSKDNVKFYKTPDAVLQKQLELYDEIAAKNAADNPLFKEIVQSQLAFARRMTRWEQDTVVSRKMAFDHYFGPNAKPVKILPFLVPRPLRPHPPPSPPPQAGEGGEGPTAGVGGDFLCCALRPRWQAGLVRALYVVFFLAGIAALIYAGADYAGDSWRIGEHSVPANGPPIYHFKTVIPIAGALVMLQGIAEVVRCVVCLQTGEWPARLRDVAEIDVIEEQLAHSEYVDEESRKIAIERAHEIDEAARQRGMGGDMKT